MNDGNQNRDREHDCARHRQEKLEPDEVVEGFKYMIENFKDRQESQHHIDRLTSPREPEISPAAGTIEEPFGYLCSDSKCRVGKKEGISSINPTPGHQHGKAALQHGRSQPE